MRSKGWKLEFTLTACLKFSTNSNGDDQDVFDQSLPFFIAFPRATFPPHTVVAPPQDLEAAEQVYERV